MREQQLADEVRSTHSALEAARQEADAEATQEGSGCQHHWVIGRPAGPVSKGLCRRCGEERDFPSYNEGDWISRGRRRPTPPAG